MCNNINQNFLVSGKICYYNPIVATRITNINNSLIMTSMRAMWHYFYVGLAWQNCFTLSVGFNIAFYGTFFFVNGRINTEHDTLDFD